MAQLVEHILGKDEVPGPNPGSSSRQPQRSPSGALVFCRACAHRKAGLSGAATLALGRVSLKAKSGSHIRARRGYLDATRQYPGRTSLALVFYRACAPRKAGLSGAATLALERVLRAKRAESGSHIHAKGGDILTRGVNTRVALLGFGFIWGLRSSQSGVVWSCYAKKSKNFKKTIDKRILRCYNLTILILKSYDEEGFYQAFSQRVGEGEIPIKTDGNLITSELGAPKRILE